MFLFNGIFHIETIPGSLLVICEKPTVFPCHVTKPFYHNMVHVTNLMGCINDNQSFSYLGQGINNSRGTGLGHFKFVVGVLQVPEFIIKKCSAFVALLFKGGIDLPEFLFDLG